MGNDAVDGRFPSMLFGSQSISCGEVAPAWSDCGVEVLQGKLTGDLDAAWIRQVPTEARPTSVHCPDMKIDLQDGSMIIRNADELGARGCGQRECFSLNPR